MASLNVLESAFLTYWNEANGPHVDLFWDRIAEAELPYTRRDLVAEVLQRGSIRTFGEFEAITDGLVYLEQTGRIDAEQAKQLSKMIGQFEKRRR